MDQILDLYGLWFDMPDLPTCITAMETLWAFGLDAQCVPAWVLFEEGMKL